MRKLVFLCFILINIYSNSLKISEFEGIVTYPLFKEENKNLIMYIGIENLENKLLKIDIKSGKKKSFTLTSKNRAIEYNVNENLKEIFYKNQNCIVITVGSSDFSQIMIFDKDLNRLQNITLNLELKNSPIIFDVNNDNLLDMLIQTDEKVYILKQNKNLKFEIIENKIKNTDINNNYQLLKQHLHSLIIDNEDKKYLMLNYSKINLKKHQFKVTYMDFYKIESNGKIKKIKTFEDKKYINNFILKKYSFIEKKINFFKVDEVKDVPINSSNLSGFLEKLDKKLNLMLENKLIKELQDSKNIFYIIKQKDVIKEVFFDCKKCVDISIFLNETNNFIRTNSIYQKEFFDRVNTKIISFLKSGHFSMKEIKEEYQDIKKEKLKTNIKTAIKYLIIFVFIILLYLFYKKRKNFIIDSYSHILLQIDILKLLLPKKILPIKQISEENFEEIFKNIDYLHSTLMYKIFTLYANLHGENYYNKVSKIFQKKFLLIDTNNRILIHNILKATRDRKRKVYNLENDYAFKLSIQLLSILSKLENYKSFWRVVEQISLYIIGKEKINYLERKDIFLTKINFLKNENHPLTIYFIQNYKIDKEDKYTFQEKSKLLSLLYPFYEKNHLSEKIKELNNLAFEKEGLFALKDNYIIITPQKDNSILKTFLAFDLKNSKEKTIRYFDKKNRDYLIKIDNLFEYKVGNISFVKYDKPIICKNYIIAIEDKSSIKTSLYSLVVEETISPFKIKEIIKRLAKFFIKLKEKLSIDGKEFNFTPNIFPHYIFYDMESDKIEIISAQLDKLKIDEEIVNNEDCSSYSYFQTPEYISNSKYYAYNLNENELEKQLVYYLAYLLYFGLNRKYPFTRENKINNDYSVSNIYNVKEKKELLLFLNELFNSNINERVNLDNFIEEVHKIYFYNINPFYAGTMLHYENSTNRSIFVGRKTELLRAKYLVESRKDKIIAIQSNKRFGKSSFCSYLYYELEKDKKLFVNIFVSGADWQGEESLYYLLANAIYQKLLHYSHIFIEPPKKENFLSEELYSFISYMNNIIENYNLTSNFIIDEFESYLIKAYRVRNRDYLDTFKNLADRLEKFNILIVSSINFKIARKIYNLPIGQLLNMDYRLILGLLSFEETEQLLNNEIIKSDKLEFDKLIIEAIYNISKGHPFFIQIYAQRILNEKNRKGDRCSIIQYENYKEFINKYEETLFGEMASLFHEFWRLFTPKEQELIYLVISDKEIDRVKYIEEIELLLRDGVLGQSNQKFYFEVPIFEKWLKNLLLEEEKYV